MKQSVALVIAMLAGLGSASTARSEMLTYTLTARGTGTLGGESFTDVLMTFRFNGDTSKVVEGGASYFHLTADPMTFSIEGIGEGTFLAPTFLWITTFNGLANLFFGVGAGASDGGFGIFQSPVLAGYDLKVEIGPVTGAFAIAIVPPYSTSLGPLSFIPRYDGFTFTAAAAVPEPSAWVTASLGASCLGLAVMRGRRTARRSRTSMAS